MKRPLLRIVANETEVGMKPITTGQCRVIRLLIRRPDTWMIHQEPETMT